MGKTSRSEITVSENIRPILNLSLTHIQLNDAGNMVEYIVCKTFAGKEVIVRAKHYALCCHAIENARQLLLSNDVQKSGIGNGYDHVGRYFMDHPAIFASRMVPTGLFPEIYDRQYANDYDMNVNLSFTDEHMKEAELLQYYCRFNPVT